jgi:hypothetical protein
MLLFFFVTGGNPCYNQVKKKPPRLVLEEIGQSFATLLVFLLRKRNVPVAGAWFALYSRFE